MSKNFTTFHTLILRYLNRYGSYDILRDDITTFVTSLRGQRLQQLVQRKKKFRHFLDELECMYHETKGLEKVQQMMAVRGMFRLRATEFTHATETRMAINSLLRNNISRIHHEYVPKKITDEDMNE